MKKENLKIQQILSLAIENHKKNNFELAESLYNKILKIDANQFQTLFLLGSLYLQTKNFTDAIKLLEKAIKIKPNHADSYHNLGFASIELGEFQKAILLLNKTIEINPKHVDAYYNIANAYKQLRNFDDAKANFKEAIKLKPDNAKAYNNLGNVLKESGKTKEAIVSYKKAIQIQPNHAKAYHNLGNTFKQLGEIKNAAASYEKSFKYLPSNLEALDALSTLKEEILDIKLKKKINEIMKNKNITKKDIAYGNFLLSKFALKERNFEQEFDYLIKGHSHYFEYKRKIFEKGIDYWLNQLPNINALMEMGKIIKKNNDEIKPIFIVGIPRCGSTLIEKILASGSKEIPIGEETAILNFLVGEEITKKLKSNFDIKYMERVIIDSYKQKGLIKQKHDNVFTDKTLDNFFFIGLIKEIFPSAKIINCRRKPIASIMSILKNNLGAVSWAHRLEHIFQFIDIYYEKINSFKKIFPNFIYELEFEKFVENPETESKKLMEYCELPWDKKCLEYYKRKDLVSSTASNIQIRRAIYQDKHDKHLPYKEFLDKYGKKYHWYN